MAKQLREGRRGPEIMPPENRLATLSPTVRLYIRRAAITSLAGFLFWFLLWCLQSFLGVRGVVQMAASRILLFFMWLSGVGLIVLGAATLPRLQRRRLFAVVVNMLWIVGVVALDKWAPKPTPSPATTDNPKPKGEPNKSQDTSQQTSNTLSMEDRRAIVRSLIKEYQNLHHLKGDILPDGRGAEAWINKKLKEEERDFHITFNLPPPKKKEKYYGVLVTGGEGTIEGAEIDGGVKVTGGKLQIEGSKIHASQHTEKPAPK